MELQQAAKTKAERQGEPDTENFTMNLFGPETFKLLLLTVVFYFVFLLTVALFFQMNSSVPPLYK